MHSEEIVKEVLSRISMIKGVQQTLVLTAEDRRKILELEEEAEKELISGLGYRDNQGVKEALKRDVVVAFITGGDYVWPSGPNLILKWKDKVIGEEITEAQIEEYRSKKNAILIGKFVLYKDRMPDPSEMAKEPTTAVFPPKSLSNLKDVKGIRDTVQGSPYLLSDTYLKRRMNAELDDVGLGTAMMGFNFERRE